MKFETVHNVTLPKVGFGTWTIGGQSTAEPTQDTRSLAALHSALALGYTHFDTAEYYAAGHAEELLGRAIREAGIAREKVFITSKVSPNHLGFEDVRQACESSLRRLGMDYLDLYLIHWPTRWMNLSETFRALNGLVREGKVRHLGVSNFNLKQLKDAQTVCETPIITNQVSYSLPDRSSVKNGVLDYCQKNDILLTAYTPLNRRFISGNKALKDFAAQRGLTTQQVALAWLVNQPRVITIPTSFDPRHQSQNLAVTEIVFSDEEMSLLTGLVR